MPAEPFGTYYRYNRWATGRVLDAAEQLTEAEFKAPGSAGGRTIQETFVHLLNTQKRWLSWWDASISLEAAYMLQVDPDDFPNLSAVRTLWRDVEKQTAAFIESIQDSDTSCVLQVSLPNGERWELMLGSLMLHVANHGTRRRSEIAAMLTGHGHSPGDLDLINDLAMLGQE